MPHYIVNVARVTNERGSMVIEADSLAAAWELAGKMIIDDDLDSVDWYDYPGQEDCADILDVYEDEDDQTQGDIDGEDQETETEVA